MVLPRSQSVFYAGIFLCSAIAGAAQTKRKYVIPPPEFFESHNPRNVLICNGDMISVVSFSSPELNRMVRVRDDGRISLPLLQGIQASGLTPEQLQQAITGDYAHEFTHPGITVDLISSANNAVYVTGEVGMPGPKEIHGRMTVTMALASAQVLSKSGKPVSTFLIRAEKAGHYNVYKLDASFPSGSARNIEVIAGDVLFVPKKMIAKADDFVDLWVRELLPATPSANLSVLFTPANATALAAVAK